jgi:gamma-glutamyltranspeptidase/glutathione hydrolase
MRAHKSMVLALLSLGLLALAPPPERSRAGMVATDHALASAAGATVLAAGGNAVDAAVAAALSCGVVQPAGSGLGGGGFAVVVYGDERLVLDFREVAPGGASSGMFLGPDGEVVEGASTKGGLAVAVPAEGRGLAELHRRLGRLPLKEVVAPALAQAARGFPVGEHLHESLARFPQMSGALFDDLSAVPEVGDRVTRRTLGRTLKRYARTDGQALSEGPLAESIAATVRAAGGVLTAADLSGYQPVERDPLVGEYRDHTVITMPPPSSGGAVLLQSLAALEAWDLAALGHNSAAHLHLLAEVFQHAYADRAAFMGDPAFTEVPLERMLSEQRILEVRRAVDPERTLPRDAYGTDAAPVEDAGTQHIAVIDGDGMAVSLTTTINTAFGSEVVDPLTGVLLNNEMDDFVAAPGVPNAFGLVGREANAVEPGKKPLSSMTPTVVLDPDGEVLMAVGGSGGPFIISTTLQVISNVLDFGLSASEAVSAPRMHHQWVPELLFLDLLGHPADVQQGLIDRGHSLKSFPFFSAGQLVLRQDGWLYGAADPRKAGEAAGAP